MPRRPDRRLLLPAAACRLLLGLLPGFAAAAETPEATVLRSVLSGPVTQSTLQAADAASTARSTLPALLANPTLEARHEEARGAVGATTDVVSVGLTVDPAFASISARSAARLRGEAADHHRQALLLTTLCEARHEALSLWAATEQARITAQTAGALAEVLATLDRIVEAGEAAGYDRDRAALELFAHQAAAAEARGEQSARQARLSAQTGAPISAVQLAPLPPLPALTEALSASAAHPLLVALQLDEDAAGQETAAARRAAVPDLYLSGGTRWDAPPQGGQAEQGYEVGAAIALPVFERSRIARQTAAAAQAAASATYAEARMVLQSTVEGAWHRAAALETIAPPEDTLWEDTRVRYLAGEADINELLQVTAALGVARQAAVTAEHRYRSARLELSCAVGRFAVPEIQAVYEEAIR